MKEDRNRELTDQIYRDLFQVVADRRQHRQKAEICCRSLLSLCMGQCTGIRRVLQTVACLM